MVKNYKMDGLSKSEGVKKATNNPILIIRLIQLLVKASKDKIVSNHYDFYKEVNHGTREAHI